MIVLGLDTATPATVVGLRLADGRTLQARDYPAPGARPAHLTRLLELAAELLEQAGLGWGELERIAVGLGPGTFTGLRIGVASARGLSQSLGVELVGVSTLRTLAEAAPAGGVLAVLDARRGEAFAAAYAGGRELLEARALAPADLGGLLEQAEAAAPGRPWLAVGDGAIRFRAELQAAGAQVPPDAAELHQVSGAAICALGACAPEQSLQTVVPDYRRRPDAEVALA
ncbi:MAG TPA: tRNA (adenosine(37)-N6)-threonylcarbamoyltransferase complex dimerization subunit type 1 TsaB [Solirubrobacteraceae bacterium]|nr:tRNA (adenosine(37)-N6)-threonylcarbamoyltransferase complex dimerization subunit type 1 TsaB [Solirubrobacteraceae bacterium]